MSKRGFTLVELAIVLIILGVMTAGGVKMINSAINSSKFGATRNQIEAVVKEIAEYSARGQNIPPLALFTNVISPTTDNFDNTISYTPDAGLTASFSICDATTTGITIDVCPDTTCTTPTNTYNDIAFFVSSNSVNGIAQVGGSATNIQIYNDSVTVNGDAYDDITGWLSLSALKKFAGCFDDGLQIVEDYMPKAYTMTTYSTEFNAAGGTAPYEWCMESSDSQVRTYFEFEGGQALVDTDSCDTASNYETSSSASIKVQSTSTLPEDGVLPDYSKVKLFLKDTTGNTVSKEYILWIHDEYEEVAAASDDDGDGVPNYADLCPGTPDGVTVDTDGCPLDSDNDGVPDYLDLCPNTPAGTTVDSDGCPVIVDDDVEDEDVPNGDTTGFSDFVDNSDGNGVGNSDYIITADTLKILQSHDTDPISVFYACGSAEKPGLPCPKFGNNGIFTAYFTSEYYHKTSHWRDPMGFTFAVIRSTYDYYGGGSITTENQAATSDNGMGYGGNCKGGVREGIKGGHSFAIEFDVYQHEPQCTDDINDNHFAIVSYVNRREDWNNTPISYSPYGASAHITEGAGTATATFYNEPCTTADTKGTGCYYSNTVDAVPNVYNNSSNLFGVRVEAIAGCNENGTVCDRETGTDNYICVFMWRELIPTMNSNSTLDTNMRDITVNHSFQEIKNGVVNPLGTAYVKDCYPDDTDDRNTMDYIRFGFTTDSWHEGQNQYYYQFTDLAVRVSEYND